MNISCTFELTKMLSAEKFNKLLGQVVTRGDYSSYQDSDTYVDYTMAHKGITVIYHDKPHKKKITITLIPGCVIGNDKPNKNIVSKQFRKFEEYVYEYFCSKYHIDDFYLSRMTCKCDIDVNNHKRVAAYIKVLRKIGKVKGFVPINNDLLDDNMNFYLFGKSNGIEFSIYDLEGILREQLGEVNSDRKKLKLLADKAEGILRVEVILTESKAIRTYTDETVVSRQINDLQKENQRIFLDTFMRIIPFGDFYKKNEAVELIMREITERMLKRRMVRLLELVPEKKSLLLAQKALNYRRVDDVMKAFANVELSPVTISKRHNVRKLNNLYKYM